jgi:hypothetical protein
VPGTYPHAEWQGTRIEGLVIAQGERVSQAYSDEMRELSCGLAGQVVRTAGVGGGDAGLRFSSDMMAHIVQVRSFLSLELLFVSESMTHIVQVRQLRSPGVQSPSITTAR